MKKRKLLLFLAKLVAVSLTIGYLWFDGLQIKYVDILSPVAEPVLMFFGASRWWLAMVVEHFTSLIPFIALVLASPGLISRWQNSLIGLVAGIAIIVSGHLLMSVGVFHIVENFGMSRTGYVFLIPLYILNDALPLILWLVFFPGVFGDLTGLSWLQPSRTGRPVKGS